MTSIPGLEADVPLAPEVGCQLALGVEHRQGQMEGYQLAQEEAYPQDQGAVCLRDPAVACLQGLEGDCLRGLAEDYQPDPEVGYRLVLEEGYTLDHAIIHIVAIFHLGIDSQKNLNPEAINNMQTEFGRLCRGSIDKASKLQGCKLSNAA